MGASSQKKFDFTLLEILIKMRTSGLSNKISYKDFCAWLGNSVEPTEAFYFRHDSTKNPQYELNQERAREQREPNQLAVKRIITSESSQVKERFIAKTFQTFKSIKKAFVEWKKDSTHIEFDTFKQMMKDWGFINDCSELFNWLDYD